MPDTGLSYDLGHVLRMRSGEGPMCEWCAVWADEWEREYVNDRDAPSSLMDAAEDQPALCRAGQHLRRWPTGPGWKRQGWRS